ncbi:MAG: hydroxymethylbilane synthase [Streptosporangiaceae bacterium]|jgi:hydroxymethylbilane synthase|nr:hydroxymethylbilane synthase [Streptosporangiaceae bacterium]
MLPGSVQAVRAALDSAGYGHVEVMPHLIFRSELYANYRATMQAAPASGTRRFQLPQNDDARAIRTGLRFLREGANSVLLEPALFSADVLATLSTETDAPLLPFSVSGECSTLDLKLLNEEYVTLLRAGASQIITYAAVELAETLTDQGRSPQRKDYRPLMSSSLVPVTPVTQTPARYFAQELPARPLRLGGRTSHLARAYAQRVIDALQGVVPGLEVEYIGIETSADRHKGDLSQLGGKGLFMKEIDKALTIGAIDIAVHCMKDVPGDVPLPKGLMFGAYLERDDIRDCVVWREGSKYARLDELPPGSVIGTSAVRRKAQTLRRYPHLRVERFRGNVVPRLAKLDESKRFEALILAKGGLMQVGQEHRIGQLLSQDDMCPAIGAGVIGVQCRSESEAVRELLLMIDHDETRLHISAERTMLHGLQGHCNSPIAGHCHTTPDGQLSLLGMVFSRDGGEFAYAHEWDSRDHAFELGGIVAATLNRKGARDIIAGIPH